MPIPKILQFALFILLKTQNHEKKLQDSLKQIVTRILFKKYNNSIK